LPLLRLNKDLKCKKHRFRDGPLKVLLVDLKFLMHARQEIDNHVGLYFQKMHNSLNKIIIADIIV
jgi:hypothetical protein